MTMTATANDFDSSVTSDVGDFWLRSVAAEPEALYRDRTWSFWQFTTTGSVPGVQGRVDRNSFNGTSGDWGLVLKWLQAGQ